MYMTLEFASGSKCVMSILGFHLNFSLSFSARELTNKGKFCSASKIPSSGKQLLIVIVCYFIKLFNNTISTISYSIIYYNFEKGETFSDKNIFIVYELSATSL